RGQSRSDGSMPVRLGKGGWRMLVLNLPAGSLRVAFSATAAADLAHQLQIFKHSWQHTPPRPELNFIYDETLYLELFCNPNIWPSPFAAQVLVTVRHPQIQVRTQMGFMQLLEDVALYPSQG
ncbi:MAG: hypothetical protein Q6J44_07965, partial [Gloeomargarita sp. DG02_4_bins_56]